MKTKISAAVILFLMMCLPVTAQTATKIVIGQQPIYNVHRAKEAMVIDGKMDEPGWKNAEVRTFDNFFRLRGDLEKQNSKFRMLWDDEKLYLFYECEDTSLMARETRHDGATHMDDCAEFFCVPVADSVYMHFGFEVNILKTTFDFVVLWKYLDGRTIFINGYDPQYEVGVTYEGTINDESDKDKGWKMEMAIPFSCFNQFNSRVKPGAKWAFQAVRQDRNSEADRFRSTSILFPLYDLKQDVHQPCHFGILEFLAD
ncbi:MAG TPA: carbohydrate-binding family 9-like protein [Bacteroidales bacterium]|jgi:hypothetical protein|nr:carbohydrate-binding family 9-like protein [Bacteroidales bacterium]HQB36128.1 carbohydrate-binding family 9-like protein [Bacteroidales bacterium]